MRLTCPNCGAEYEVPDDAIPDSGRDVQCSNCGHTWFEAGAAALAEAEADDLPEPPAPPPIPEPRPDQSVAMRDRPVPDPDAPRPGEPEPDPDALHPDPGQPVPQRRLDPAVASVLREEREASEALRRGPAPQPMEHQQDLPLAEPPPKVREPVAPGQPRRDRLQNVEDINMRLEDAGKPPAPELTPEEQETQRHRKGFRYGFGFVVLIAAAAALVYVNAAAIAGAVPALEAPLTSYSEAVDSLRLSLDSSVRSLTERLSASDPG